MKKKALVLLCLISLCLTGCTVNGIGSNQGLPNDITVTIDFQSDSAAPKTESSEELGGTTSGTETAVVEESVNWTEMIEFPTTEEIAAYTNPNNSLAPGLGAWLSVPAEARYSEYSIDFKADHIPIATYCCLGQWSLDYSSLEEEYAEVNYESSGAYGGFQHNHNGMQSIIAFWDVYCTDELGNEVVIRAERLYPTDLGDEDFGGEGEGAHCLVPYAWEADHWYRMHVKCVESEETGTTWVEQWVCDLETGEWTLLSIYDLKAKDVMFKSSPAIFLENYLSEYAGEVRSMEVRNAKYLDAGSGLWTNITHAYMSSNGGAPAYEGCYNFGTFQDRIWMICSGVGGDWYNNGKGRTDAELIFGE